MAATFDQLAGKIAPELQSILNSRREQIVLNAGTIPARIAVRMAFPVILDEIPELTRDALTLVVTEFGNMNVQDLLQFIDQRIRSSSRGDETPVTPINILPARLLEVINDIGTLNVGDLLSLLRKNKVEQYE